MRRSYQLSFLLLLFLLIPDLLLAQASGVEPVPITYWNFETGLRESSQGKLTFSSEGAALVKDPEGNVVVRFEGGNGLSIDAVKLIDSRQGTISLWLKPHEDNFGRSSSAGKTFFSFHWDDTNNGYAVLSDGWWEHAGGRPFTYLIFNNQSSAKTEKRIAYRAGDWMQFVCTWKTGREGRLRLYLDGLLVAESTKGMNRILQPKGKIYLGSDAGAPGAKKRTANTDLDDFAVFDRELGATEVRSWFLQTTAQKKSAENKSGKQMRAIFDENRGWMTERGAREIIRRVKQAGFNVYIPCVWHGMGSRYPTSLAPAEKGTNFTDGDPLERLIRTAHAEGIEVHPWFTVMLRQREFFPEFYDEGTPEDAFNVHNPGFRQFISELMLDVVRRYDVDGINLDFIRSMGFCTSRACQKEYRKLYDRGLMGDILKAKTRLGLEPTLQEWSDVAVEKIVTQVATRGRQLNPGLVVSVDGAPAAYYQTPSLQGRNELRWAQKGLVDVIFNMDYKRNPDLERLKFVRQKITTDALLLPLLGNYDRVAKKGTIRPRPGNEVASLARVSLSRFSEGFGLYIYSQLSDEQVVSLGNIKR